MKRKVPKVAIVHDYLRTYGGGERVLELLHEIWPNAPIFVATVSEKRMGIFFSKFSNMIIHTSWVQKIPFLADKPILYRPFLPFVWSSFDLSGFDIVISSSGSNIAKLVNTPDKTMHICYCHTPPRFLYNFETELDMKKFPYSVFIKPLNTFLRKFDLSSSKEVDYFIANSKEVAKRIKQIYHKKVTIINPPVSLPKFKSKTLKPKKYYLVVSRLVRNKHIDLIIKTANKLKLPLKIIGNGNYINSLREIADPTIEFLGEVTDKKLSSIYSQAKALLVASKDEDFGITPIEAMSFGVPVIAYKSGGLKETVIPNKTGIFYTELSQSALEKAIQKFARTKIESKDCLKQAKKYSKSIFIHSLKSFVDDKWGEFNKRT